MFAADAAKPFYEELLSLGSFCMKNSIIYDISDCYIVISASVFIELGMKFNFELIVTLFASLFVCSLLIVTHLTSECGEFVYTNLCACICVCLLSESGHTTG
jgi:hypothetical protein